MPMPTELKPSPTTKIKPTIIEVVPLWAYVVMAVLALIAVVMGSLYIKTRIKP